MTYLTAEEAQTKLIASGLFASETAPSLETLTSALELIESKIDSWVGYSLSAIKYRENIRSNSRGIVLLTNYPVIEVVKVEQIRSRSAAAENPPEAAELEMPFEYSSDRSIAIYLPNARVKVTYTAGYEAGSAEMALAKGVVLSVLMKIVSQDAGEETDTTVNWWDLNFLNQYQRYVTSLSLPGGLTQSFKVMDGGGSGGSNQWDELLSPLAGYRRTIMTAMPK